MADLEARKTWQLSNETPFQMRASMGHISDARTVFIFGNNPDVKDVEETVWYHGGMYTYPTAAITMQIAGSDAACSSIVVVNGLDASYNEISEVITVTGQTPQTLTHSYLRIQNAYVIANETLGDIYIGVGAWVLGVPATVYARIHDGDNRSQAGMYTVPAGHTLYLPHGTISHGSDSSAYITGKFKYRMHGSVFHTAAVVTLNNNYIHYQWQYPLALPEKTDIAATAICSKNQINGISVSFEGLLVREAQ